MSSDNINLIVSYLILFPTSVILENNNYDDGVVHNFYYYFLECFGVFVLCSVFSIILYGLSKLLKMDISFVKVLYRTNFSLSIIILIICSPLVSLLIKQLSTL